MLFFIFFVFVRGLILSVLLTFLVNILPQNTILEFTPEKVLGIEIKATLSEMLLEESNQNQH